VVDPQLQVIPLAEDSLERFLYRFWIENEIAFQLQDGQALTGRFGAYAALIR
jgi:hypothetical protein